MGIYSLVVRVLALHMRLVQALRVRWLLAGLEPIARATVSRIWLVECASRPLRRMAHNKEAAFHPFDLLDDGLGLAILRCLAEPESLCCAAQVCTRFAKLCEEPYAWKLLLDTALSSSGEGLLVLPSEGMGWRERARLEQRHLSAARVAVI